VAKRARKKRGGIKPIPCFNLEAGMPTLEEAKTTLTSLIETQRRQGAHVIKIIHGYGSSGEGGKLRFGLRHYLSQLQMRQSIKGWVAGEDLMTHANQRIPFMDIYPAIRSDPDFGHDNAGVTLIIIT